MYPASDWSSLLRAIMDISARAISLPDRPRRGPFGSPVFAGAGKTDLHLSVSSRRPRRVPLWLWPHRPVPLFVSGRRSFAPACPLSTATRAGAVKAGAQRRSYSLDGAEHGASITRVGATAHCFSSPRSCARERAPPRRCGQACWRARLPARCGVGASWRSRSSS